MGARAGQSRARRGPPAGDYRCVAAKASSPLAPAEPKPEDVRAWLAELPALEKDDILARMIAGDGALESAELGHHVDSATYRKQVPQLRQAPLDAQPAQRRRE